MADFNNPDFSSLFDDAPAMIAIIEGPQHVYKYANKLYLKSVRKSGEGIVGKPINEALPELKDQGYYEILDKVFESGEPFRLEEAFVFLDSEETGVPEPKYYNLTFTAMKNKDGSIHGIFIHALDITKLVSERKEAEANREFLHSLIDSAPMPIALFRGPDFIVEMANTEILEAWNKSDDIIGKKFADALPELHDQPFLSLLQEVYKTGTEYHAKEQKAMFIFDGKLKPAWYNFTFKPIFDETGKVEAILDMAIDVTYQVNAKEQLLHAQSKLQTAIDVADLGTWELDPYTGMTIMNGKLKNWRGLDEEGVINIYDIFQDSKYNDTIKTAIAQAIDPAGDGILNVEYDIENKKTGEIRRIYSQGKTFFDSENKAVVITGIARDITMQRTTESELARQVKSRTSELAGANDELKSLNANLEQFVYVASHDLQEPLRKIKIFSEMLEQSSAELNSDGKLYIDKISKASKRMSLLINDLLEFSRVSSKEKDFTATDLNRIINDVIIDYELLIRQTNAVIKTDVLPVVEAIPLQMNQLFYNLIGNALKFSKKDEPPRITIRAAMLDEGTVQNQRLSPDFHYCCIEVKDEGIGFDPQYAKKIFEIFQRLHGKHEYAGTGIGLALSKKIADNHGGTILAESKEDEGATFSVILPVNR